MSGHCGTCSCGTKDYGITFVGGVKDGETYVPLATSQICYWNRHWWAAARLVIRVRPDDWRRATDDEVDEWNKTVMLPHVRGAA